LGFYKKVRRYFSLSVPINKIAVVSNPEYARYILLDNNKNYRKSLAYEFAEIITGQRAAYQRGRILEKQGGLAQPPFTVKS